MTAKIKTIRSSWWEGYGYRLDCQPYLAGALETKIILEGLSLRKDRLDDLTTGPEGGIFHAGREKRYWVDSPEFGVPFLGSTDILAADLSNLPFIAKKQIEANPLLLIRKGYTLITRSGTIGRMAYTRPDMDGLACSEHVLRVSPDPQKIPSGYLYAFLSSKFGIPLVISGTYGSIIQGIEPEHIADIPVPRLDPQAEWEIHERVEKAAALRTEAQQAFQEALNMFHRLCELPTLPTQHNPVPFGTTSCRFHDLNGRLDTHYHSRSHQEAMHAVRDGKFGADTVGKYAESIVEPARFKRIQTGDSAEGGIPFFGTAALMQFDPEPMYSIWIRGNAEQYRVSSSTLLIPRSGQIYGIIGTPVLPIGQVIGGTVTEDAIRVNCANGTTAGYLYIALNSEYGKRQLKCRAYGSSIPHLDVANIAAVSVPAVPPEIEQDLGNQGLLVAENRNKAIELEEEARLTLIEVIESQE